MADCRLLPFFSSYAVIDKKQKRGGGGGGGGGGWGPTLKKINKSVIHTFVLTFILHALNHTFFHVLNHSASHVPQFPGLALYVIKPSIFQMKMEEPCFDVLRTREQLG